MVTPNTNLKINIKYLKEYKRLKQLTNKELAKQIGVHESTISRVLSEKKGVGQKFIIGVLFRLKGIDLEKLFVPESPENNEKVI